jgi:hypothetical protein
MATPISILSGGTRGFELGIFKNGSVAQGFNFPLSSNYRWWNGVDVLATQYLIYTDKYTMGSSTLSETIPVAWATPDLTDQSLINLINTLPPRVGQPSFTSLQPALDWLQGTNNFYLIKNGLENIVTTNLQLYYDAGLYTSYVGTGTSVIDISGNNRTGTLINGTGFISSGVAAFNFDGTDDQIGLTSQVLSGSDSFTVNCWIQADSSETGGTVFGNYPAGNLQIFYGSQYMGMWLNNNSTYVDSPVPLSSNPVMITAVRDGSVTYFYQNGILLKQGSSSASIGTTTDFRLGINTINNEQFNGKIFITQVYNISLTQSQILQNYNAQKGRFGLPTNVTNGLVAQLEAGNPSSYPGSGNIWYDISGNNNNFTLFNGASYDSTTKSMVFDGSDDYARSTNFIDLSSASGVTVQTISKQDNTNVYMLWEHTPNWNSYLGGFGSAVNDKGNGASVNEFHANWNGQGPRNFINTAPSSLTFFSHTHRLIKNNLLGFQDWINTDLQTFVIGAGYSTGTSTVGNNNGFANDYTYLASRAGSGALLDGNIGVFLMYNRPLSQPEIVQNYEYYRSIYGLSGVTKNGLVLWYDAGNNQSYPSQGKTWYDISGSMVDGRLLNGPTYSTDGGGSIVFDGADDYISCGTSIPPAGNISVFDWVYVSTFQTPWNILITKWFDPSASDFHWALKSDGSGFKQNLYTTNNSDMFGNSYFSTGTWYYVGFTLINGGTLTFYVNGNTDGTHSSVSRTPQSSNLIIGDNRNVAYGLVGKMGTVQIYNRSLSGAEVLQNFNAQKSRFGL